MPEVAVHDGPQFGVGGGALAEDGGVGHLAVEPRGQGLVAGDSLRMSMFPLNLYLRILKGVECGI